MATTSLPQQHDQHQQPRDNDEVIIGVDTHKDVHVVAVLSTVGALLATASFTTTLAGCEELIAWVRSHGEPKAAGVEGTGSWGAGLTQVLHRQGITVIEVNRPDRSMRRRQGKTDAVDAEAAARAVLAGQATVTPKSHDGLAEAMRLYKLAKDSALKARTQAINQLKGVLVNGDPVLREELTGKTTHAQVMHCLTLSHDSADPVQAARHRTLRTLAERIRHLSAEIRDLEKLLTTAVTQTAPRLLDLFGVGHDCAATLLIAAGDNVDRLSSEAALAALCGVSPVERSPGKTQRRRLNRGGNRQANAALFRIALTRVRADDRTRAYVQRRTTEGRTKREILRCLKRYIAREIFAILRGAVSSTVA